MKNGTTKSRRRIGVYPGTFDPMTSGHVDIVRRASKLVDRLIIGVASNEAKKPVFSQSERVAIIEEVIRDQSSGGAEIIVQPFDMLLIHFAQSVGASVVIRGLRAVSDFEYEFQMAGMNDRLSKEIETVFLMAEASHQAIASSLVKEIARLGGDTAPFVPEYVQARLLEKFGPPKEITELDAGVLKRTAKPSEKTPRAGPRGGPHG